MPKFFQAEKAAYAGRKNQFSNVDFKKGDLDTSAAAESGTVLEIIPVHIKNPPVIQFISYMNSITDTFGSQYTADQPFGRPDPYYMWKSSKRTIKVGFQIPSSSKTTALENLNNLSWFLASLYPTYKDTTTSTSIAASPLFRIKFANLICSSTKDGQGLLGVLQNVTVTHDTKQGFIGMKPENMGSAFGNVEAKLLKQAGFENSISEGKKFLMPKSIKLGFTINVVHDHSLGWDFSTGNWRGGLSAPRFPYDFGLLRDTQDTPSAGSATFEDTPGSSEDRERQAIADDITGAGITQPTEQAPPASEFNE
jgi:hypothetical protein